jgi:hypothetical protein
MKSDQYIFRISDYDETGGSKLGIFFYGEEILFGWEKNFGKRSYKFKLKVQIFKKDDKIGLFSNKEKIQEDLRFVFTCNLKKYAKTVTYDTISETNTITQKTRKKFDFDKLIKDSNQEHLLEYIKTRLKRRIEYKKVLPVKFKDGYGEPAEFLEFTKDSADSWAGPHQHNNMVGCACAIKESKKKVNFNVSPVSENYTYWSLGKECRDELDKKAKELNNPKIPNGDWLLSTWNKDQKREFFDKLPIDLQACIAISYYKNHSEYLREKLPYQIYLYGNDDCSYSKYFGDMRAVNKEMEYLRNMQPLDFNRDIVDRDYIFTN